MTAVLRVTQLDAVRGVLADGRWHSTLEFVQLGILRPAARVHELRRSGAAIETRRIGRPERSAVFEYRASRLQAVARELEDAITDVDEGGDFVPLLLDLETL